MISTSTLSDRRGLWAFILGVILVTGGVLMHAPMFLMGRHNHFILVGMPIGWDMIVGMVAIVGYFYFGQDERLKNEAAVLRGTHDATEWLLSNGYTNVLVGVANECDVSRYDHAILRAPRIHELLTLVRETAGRDRSRLIAGTSFGGGSIPSAGWAQSRRRVPFAPNGLSELGA